MDGELCQTCGAYWDCEHSARIREPELQYVAPDGQPSPLRPEILRVEGADGGPTTSIIRRTFAARREHDVTPLSRMYRTAAPLNPPVPGRDVILPVRSGGTLGKPVRMLAALVRRLQVWRD